MNNRTLKLTALTGIAMIAPGDDLVEIIMEALTEQKLNLIDGDILVIAQKIISKSEGRLVNLSEIEPSQEALELAEKCEKSAALMELVISESHKILRTRPGTVIVEHKLGFVCANAGIDRSNVAGEASGEEEWVLLLPKDPDASAENIRRRIQGMTRVDVGVLIIDSHGRAWRLGTVGVAIGMAGVPGLVDLRGNLDLMGYELKITQVGAADELAASASLVMGQGAEGTPVIHVRGFPYSLRESGLKELIRPKDKDLFR